MTLSIKHKFTSPQPDGNDDTVVRPSNWNDEHALAGFGTAAALDVGTGVQAYSANLDSWSLVAPGSYLTVAAAAAAYQPLSSNLTSWAAVAPSSYLTTTAAAAAYQPLDSDLTTWAGLTPSANFQTMVPHTFAQMRTDLGLVIGTNVQAWDADLDTWATKTAPSGTVLGNDSLDTDGTLAANSDSKIATQKAVKTYADQIIAAADVMVFKGVIDCSANPNYPAADAGWSYRVSVAGKIGGASGVNVEVGDLLLCIVDGTASGNQATVGAKWSIAQTNIDGAVTGPASSTSGNIATFSGTSGKVVQDGGKALPSGAIVGTSDTQTLTNKTFDLASNSLTGTTAQFNAALSDNDFATLAGNETLSNKTLASPSITTGANFASGSVINWASGDVLLTHSSNLLAFSGASGGYSFDASIIPATSGGASLGSTTNAFQTVYLVNNTGAINWGNGAHVFSASFGAFIMNVSGTAATFRLLPNGNDIWFQNTVSSGNINFSGNSAGTLTGNVNFICSGTTTIGVGSVATTSTVGGIQIQTCAGTPTGAITPTTGMVYLIYDTTAHKLWSREGGSWRSVTFT